MVGDRGVVAAPNGGNIGGNCKTPKQESFSYQHVSSCMWSPVQPPQSAGTLALVAITVGGQGGLAQHGSQAVRGCNTWE